ncbi:MAG: CBS domain-containing protein, partial [Peptococcaceae bacterium]|nr:CBS domain-containing protein [Peptococcaceae bacterium]
TKEVWIELGLQSIHDKTAKRCNRGHDYQCFLDCIERLKDYAEDSIPVLNEDNELLGVITSQDIVEVVDDEMSEEPVMVNAMLVDAQASPAANGTMNDAADVNGAMEKFAILSQDSYSYTFDESRADLTVEETLKLAQDNLSELEAHLAALDDTAENDALREELQNKIEELKAEIIVLEEQINTKE